MARIRSHRRSEARSTTAHFWSNGMNRHLHHLLATLLFTTSLAAFSCDADVLRLNYRKAPAPKPAAKAATASTKGTATLLKNNVPSAPLTAFMKLEPR